MQGSRRKNRLLKYRKKKNRSFKGLAIVFIAIFFVGLFWLFLFLTTKYWRADKRTTLVINSQGGDLIVTTFNPGAGEIANIYIPGSTQLVVSRQLGSWRAKSIWKLGENEKLSGELLRETVVKNFHFPAVAWADGTAEGLANGNFWPAIKSVFSTHKTNLGFGDRLKMAIFSIGIKNTKRTDILLKETSYLKPARLVDGEDGFLLSGSLPDELLIIFAEPEVARKGLKAVIVDASGKALLGQDVGETLEVLGIKVASVEKPDVNNFDCLVRGKEVDLVKKLAQLYSCEKENKSPESKFDIEFKIGESFAKRY